MPTRLIREGILDSERVNTLSWAAEVFYRRLMSVADDHGLCDGRPAILRARLYPLKLDQVSESDVVKWTLETEEAGLVRSYQAAGKGFLAIENFGQQVRSKPKHPPPPWGHLKTPDNNCSQPLSTVHLGVGVVGGEDVGEKRERERAREAQRIVDLWPKRSKLREALEAVTASLVDGASLEAIETGTQAIAAAVRARNAENNKFTPSAGAFFDGELWRDSPEAFASRYDSRQTANNHQTSERQRDRDRTGRESTAGEGLRRL